MSQFFQTAQGVLGNPVTSTSGGTGVSNPTAHTVPIAEGASPFNFVGPGTAGQVLISGGAAADPLYTTNFKINSDVMTNTSQPAFLAFLPSTELNKVGNAGSFTIGSATALTEVFDQGSNFNTNGTFTAPVTGKYQLSVMAGLTGCTINTANIPEIITTGRTYFGGTYRGASALDNYSGFSVLANMTAGDTATFTVAGQGEAANTDDVAGNATLLLTYVSGQLIC